MRRHFLRALAAVLPASLLALTALPAQAHETRSEGGVQAVVGWSVEPAYVGFPNAVSIHLTRAGSPVELTPDELKVEVSFGGQKTAPLALTPAFNSPGEYRAALIPTRGGEYTFRFFGTIGGEPYDQSYTSGEETFDSPRNPADVSFPAKDPTVGELAARVDELAGGDEDATGGGTDSTGRIAIGLAALALLVAIAAFARKGRTA